MKVQSLTTSGILETTTLNTELFAGEANPTLMAQAVRVYRSAARQGTAKTKTRGEISRTKKKWFKQKHTGNARHGARTPNIFVGGGVSHGPTGTQNWHLTMPQGMRRQALRSALISQASNVIVTEAFHGETKQIRQMLKQVITENSLTLVILAQVDESAVRALRNLPNVKVVTVNHVNIMDVAIADRLVLTQEAITKLEQRLTGKAEKAETKVVAVAKPARTAKTPTTTKAEVKKSVAKVKPAVKLVKPVAKPAKPVAKKVTKKASK